MKKLFAGIGQFFTHLFSGAKKTWNKLSPEVQTSILHGSGIVSVINNTIDQLPDFVLEAILKKFPDLTKEKLHEWLTVVFKELKIASDINDPDLLTLIANIQGYLKSKKGKFWASASDSIAKIIAFVSAPAETKVASLFSLMTWAYHFFFHKDKKPTV